jgi:hypothetical protein
MLARIVGVVGSASFPVLTPQEKQALQVLLPLGVAQLLNLKGLNAYPSPGTAASPSALSKRYPHVTSDSGQLIKGQRG